jgi:hypothetical protein
VSHIFLSYSKVDHFFADHARVKLEENQIQVWQDQGQLRLGDDWRAGIDQGIAESFAVIVALSTDSMDSSYVTYEWASAMGKGKPIIPLLVRACRTHPKLEAIQFLDFTIPGEVPWGRLIERVKEIENDAERPEYDLGGEIDVGTNEIAGKIDPVIESILKYLNERGYQVVSFNRLREKHIVENLKDKDLENLIEQHRRILRPAVLKGGNPGLAKL